MIEKNLLRQKEESNIQEKLETASFINPPAIVQSYLNAGTPPIPHLQLLDFHANGNLVLLGENGRLSCINLFQKTSKLVELICSPPLPAEAIKRIESIKFNALGDRIMLAGKQCLYVLAISLDNLSSIIQPDAFRKDRYAIQLRNGSTIVKTLKGSETNFDRIKQKLKQNGVEDIMSISQEIYTAKTTSVGYFNASIDLTYRHVAWHPYSNNHVVVLNSSDKLLLYNIAINATEPEQSHAVCRPRDTTHGVSFCFGAKRCWERFTIYVLLSNADIISLTPIVPRGLRLPSIEIEQLLHLTNAELTIAKRADKKANITLLKARKYWLETVWIPITDAAVRIEKKRANTPAPARQSGRFTAPDDDSDDSDPETEPKATLPGGEASMMAASGMSETGINETSWPVSIQGPLKVSPTSKVAAETKKPSACSIIAIQPQSDEDEIMAFPVVARAYRNGHVECIVLNQAIEPQWGASDVMNTRDLPSGLLIESVYLGFDDDRGAPLLLNDPSHADLIFCSHATGVYLIRLNWLSQLGSADGIRKAESCIRRVFSVSPSAFQHEKCIVVGTGVIYDMLFGHAFVLRLSTGNFELVNVTSLRALLAPSVNATSAESLSSASTTSPSVVKPTTATEKAKIPSLKPFGKVLADIAKFPDGVSVLSGSTKLNEVDEAGVQFLIDTINSFKSEEITIAHELVEATKTRHTVHKDLLASQQKKAASTRTLIDDLIKESKKLQKRFDTIQAAQENLQKRSAAVLQALRENQPCLSKAEVAYHDELSQMDSIVRRLKPQITEQTIKASRNIAESTSVSVSSLPIQKLTDKEQKMCHEVLNAEKLLLEDATSMIESVESKLKDMQLV